MGKPNRIGLAERLERHHPALGDIDAGVTIGIGITTGADSVFLTRDPDAVEPERLLPLVTAADLSSPNINWSGTYLIDPWETSGDLINLDRLPRLANHLRAHEAKLRDRHIGKRLPHQWHRTIDRKIPGLRGTPKLLLADLRPALTPVLDRGEFYPHHNLSWITSTKWDLEVLSGLLMSDYANLFIQTYAPRMAGGAYRITAQYIRRVRVPAPDTLQAATSRALAEAFRAADTTAANEAARDACRLT